MKNKETKASIEAFNSYLVEGVDTEWRKNNAWRKANKASLRKSAKIALKLNRFLRDNNIRQKQLAKALGVSPQQVNKILKGCENLTLDTVTKIETILGIELISVLGEHEVIVRDELADLVFSAYRRFTTQYSRVNVIAQKSSNIQFSKVLRVTHRGNKTTVPAKPNRKSTEHLAPMSA